MGTNALQALVNYARLSPTPGVDARSAGREFEALKDALRQFVDYHSDVDETTPHLAALVSEARKALGMEDP